MSLIYVPKGKAREYSPLALNVYTGGCDHACDYCYCAGIGPWGRVAKPRDLAGLDHSAKQAGRQVLLSFMGDPYCNAETQYRNTRKALEVLSLNRCSVAVLTKGGMRCIDDLFLFVNWPGGRVKVGATLTFLNSERSKAAEPGAALPFERLQMLCYLKKHCVKTWASIEPVIDPEESLDIIRASMIYVDGFKIGKLNHRATDTDWEDFCGRSVELLRGAKKTVYVKYDLQQFAPPGFLLPEERDPETMFLPDRPPNEGGCLL